MDFEFFKATLRRCKPIYGKLVTFSISLALILILAFVLAFTNSYFGILSFVLFCFGFLPLLLSFELVTMRLLSGYDANYNEIYKNYKAYYAPIFRGAYGVIVSFLLTFIVMDVLTSFFVSLISMNHPDLFESFMNTMNMEVFINVSYFPIGLIVILGLTILFLGYRILSKVTIPYFNFYFGLPTQATKRMVKLLKSREPKRTYKKQFFTISLPLLFIFCLLYFPLSIGLYFVVGADYASLIGLISAFIGCALYFPIFLSGAFLTSYTHRNSAIYFIKESIKADLEAVEQNPNIPEDEKKKYRELYQLFDKKTEEDTERTIKDIMENGHKNTEDVDETTDDEDEDSNDEDGE